jgi:hypothetical protein
VGVFPGGLGTDGGIIASCEDSRGISFDDMLSVGNRAKVWLVEVDILQRMCRVEQYQLAFWCLNSVDLLNEKGILVLWVFRVKVLFVRSKILILR